MKLIAYSIHQAREDAIKQHDFERPFAPENGLPLAFFVGQQVRFIPTGRVFSITKIMKRENNDPLYAYGYRYYLSLNCPWMPATESSLEAVMTSFPDPQG